MQNFENLFTRLIQNSQFLKNFAIASLLCFIPFLNLLAFGYLYKTIKNIRVSGRIIFSEWEGFEFLFIDGLRLLIIFLTWAFLPYIFGFLILNSELLCSGSFSGIGLFDHHIFLTALKFIVLSTFCSSLYRYQSTQSIYSLLEFNLIFKMSFLFLRSQIFVLATAYGLFFIFMPLYGFSIFSMLVVLLFQSTFSEI